MAQIYCQQSARQPGDIISERRATSSRNRRATSSESAGYRKALEFLIKDYVIRKHPEDEAAIKAKPLGRCINDDVEDPKTKAVAKRATWLGNDETHYLRRWLDRDLSDLKRLIGLVLYWIEAEHLTEEAFQSMPDPSDPS